MLSSPRNRTAAGLMLGCAVLQSLMPLFVTFGGAENSPFAFNAAWRVGTTTAYALILTSAFRGEMFNRATWRLIGNMRGILSLLLWSSSFLDLALYAWSTRFINVAVSAALFGSRSILLVVFTERLFKREARYRKITARVVLFFCVALLGMASVVASHAGGFGAFFSVDKGGELSLALGVALALGAVGLSTLSA